MSTPREREFWRMNAFTDVPFTGNPAAVVPDADGLSEEQMQRIAPELNSVSETVFVMAPGDASADLRLRYFTSTMEVDLCGHATIACLFVLAAMNRVRGDNGRRTVRAETRVGTLELGCMFRGRRMERARMAQLVPEVARPTVAQSISEILGIAPEAIRSDMDIGCCSTGIWACYVPLVDLDALAAVRVRHERIEDLWPDNPDLAGVYPFVITDETGAPDVLATRGRFFCRPRYGIPEDPVTGTACGALGGWLMDQGLLDRSGVLHARQGVEMGRPGEVRVSRSGEGAMQVEGGAVAVARGRILV